MRAFEFDSIAITPNIDELKSQSTIYNFAYCQEAMCNPSRSSILTGMRPDSTRIHNSLKDKLRQFNPNVITLPQAFKKAGYKTIGIGKIFHHSDPASWSITGTNQNKTNLVGGFFTQVYKNLYLEIGKRNPYEIANVHDSTYDDGSYTLQAIKFLKQEANKTSQPFFLAVGFKKPHLPYIAPKKYWQLNDIEAINGHFKRTLISKPYLSPEWTTTDLTELNGYYGVPKFFNQLHPDSLSKYRHGYYACLSYIDAQIGMIVSTLKSENLYDSTTIVLVSDHGYKLGEYESWSKLTNFEIDNKVPLLIKLPGQFNKKVNNNIVELIDIFPTLCDLNGISLPKTVDGTSLLKSGSGNFAINQFKMSHYQGYSIRTNDFRYTAWELGNEIVSEELYNKKSDLYDRYNVINEIEYKDDIAKLRLKYDSIRGTLNRNRDFLQSVKYKILDKSLFLEFESALNYVEVTIYSLEGRRIHTEEFHSQKGAQIILPNHSGLMLARISSRGLNPRTIKFIVQ